MFVEVECRHCDWSTSLDIPDHYFEPGGSISRKIPYPKKTSVYGELLDHHEGTSIVELREAFTGRLVEHDDIIENPVVQSRSRGHSSFSLYRHQDGTESGCGSLEVSSLLVVFTKG